jgi:hypothetical protein
MYWLHEGYLVLFIETSFLALDTLCWQLLVLIEPEALLGGTSSVKAAYGSIILAACHCQIWRQCMQGLLAYPALAARHSVLPGHVNASGHSLLNVAGVCSVDWARTW